MNFQVLVLKHNTQSSPSRLFLNFVCSESKEFGFSFQKRMVLWPGSTAGVV